MPGPLVHSPLGFLGSPDFGVGKAAGCCVDNQVVVWRRMSRVETFCG